MYLNLVFGSGYCVFGFSVWFWLLWCVGDLVFGSVFYCVLGLSVWFRFLLCVEIYCLIWSFLCVEIKCLTLVIILC